MSNRNAVNKWIDYGHDPAVVTLFFKVADDAEFFEKPEDMIQQVCDHYKKRAGEITVPIVFL